MDLSIVYMVAGLSSRFGGQIKSFAKIGPKGETLIDYSLSQALSAGFNKIIFIVGEKTETAFKEKFGQSYLGVPVFYALQSFDHIKRDKPWGTVDALCSAKDIINGDFVICNADDIYGQKAFQLLADHLKNKNTSASIGYKIKNVLSDTSAVNRGKFEINSDNTIKSIVEILGVTKENLSEKNLTLDSLCSMNLWALKREIIAPLAMVLEGFKNKNRNDRKAECYLPNEIGNLIAHGEMTLSIYPTDDKCLGVTNPDDVEIVRKKLA